MAKPTISIPDGMLEDIDRRAAVSRITRSAFIQEAVTHYGQSLDRAQEQDARAERIGRAIEKMRAAADKMPPGVDGTAIIRHFRDTPPRWLDEQDQR